MARGWLGVAIFGATAFAPVLSCADVGGLSGGSDGDAGLDVEAAPDAAACTTFMCGDYCVKPDDPAFGCAPSNLCRPCPGPANATSVCANDACAVQCAGRFLDCDGKPDTGCEVDPNEDSANCGACGKPCSANAPYCVGGACTQTCTLTTCGSACVDTNGSVANCGGCGHACPNPPNGNGTAGCVGGKCVYLCADGYADCDGQPGCDAFVRGNDVTHCGSCSPCPTLANATAKCITGACTLASCNAGFADCDTNGNDGCECNVSTTNICRGDLTCGPCSPFAGPCGRQKDCCSDMASCVAARCCGIVGAPCGTDDTLCCSGHCVSGQCTFN